MAITAQNINLKPGYKQTEVGMIPEDWGVSKVGTEFEIQLGKMLDAEKNTGLPKPYIGNKAVQWNHIDISDLQTMAMSRSDLERFRLRRGDLLVCEGGEVGRAAIWEATIEECYYQKALHRLRTLRGFNPRLMLALLRYWTDHGKLADYVSQTSIAHLTREKFIEVPMPVPPPDEQRAIITVLSDVDALITLIDRLIAKKREIKQAMMQQLLTGKTRLPGFSGDWEVKKLDEIAEIDSDNLSNNTHSDYSFKYISLEDVDNGVLKSYSEINFHDAPSRARRKVKKNDILVSTVRPNLKSHLYIINDIPDLVCSTGFSVLRCYQTTDPGYVYYHLFAEEVGRQIESLLAGSNYPAINGSDVRALRIPFPPLTEQQAIAAVLSDMDCEIAALEQKRDKMRALKQGMMQELLTGKTRLI